MSEQPKPRVESPFPDYAWPKVWSWVQPFRGRLFDDCAPATVDEFVRLQLEKSALPNYPT